MSVVPGSVPRTVAQKLSEHPSVLDFNARGNGTTDDAAAIQAAIDATPTGSTLFFPKRNYLLKGTGTELLLSTSPIRLIFEPGAALLIDPSVGATTDVLRLLPPTGGGVDYHIQGMIIRPVSGNPARHGILIDCTTDPLFKSVFERLNIQSLGGCAIFTNNPTPLQDGFFLSAIRDSYFGGLVGDAAINLTGAGDSIHIVRCTFFGDELGILADLVFGAHGLMMLDCNSSAGRGFLKLVSGDSATIYGGDIEATVGAAGTVQPAIIHVSGKSLTVTGASNATPIVITAASTLTTGTIVTLVGVAGNTAANGTWTATRIDATHFSLDFSAGNGAYTGGGIASVPVRNCLIDCRYLGVATIPRGITIDYALNTNIRSVECAMGYGPGVAGSNEMIHITANAVNTTIGNHVTFDPDLPSRRFLDESPTTIYPPAVNPQPNSPLLRDAHGSGQLISLVTNSGTIGYFQNAAFQSEQFDLASWQKLGCTSSLFTSAPDGSGNAKVLIEDTSNGQHAVFSDTGLASSGERWWWAVFVKASIRTQATVELSNSTTSRSAYATFDLTNGAVVVSNVSGCSGLIAYSIPYPDGWYRCVVSVVTNTWDDVLFFVMPSVGGSHFYLGTGAGNLLIFGASVSKDFLSPYIRTSSTLPAVPPSYGLLINAPSAQKANRIIGPTYLPGPVTFLNPDGATAVTLQVGATQAGTPLLIVQDIAAGFLALLSATGEWSFANGKHLYGRDTASATIAILTWEIDDTIKVGWQTAPASNGHLLLYANGLESARCRPDLGFQTAKGIYPSGSATTGFFAGTGSPNTVVTAAVGSIFMRTDGGAGTSIYVKETGTGNTGWVAYAASGGSGGPPSGAAGGELAGTYPNPTLNHTTASAAATSSLALSGTMTDVAGASVSLAAGKWLVNAVFAFSSQGGFAGGGLNVGGTLQAGQAQMFSQTTIGQENVTAAQSWIITVVGTQTVKLQACITGGGAGSCLLTNTTINAVKVA